MKEILIMSRLNTGTVTQTADQRLLRAYARRLNTINASRKGKGLKPLSNEQLVQIARSLNNVRQGEAYAQKEMRIRSGLAATQPADVATKSVYLDVATAAIANFIIPDICSMQNIDGKLGQIPYLKFIYADDKGAVENGRIFNSSFKQGPSDKDYSSRNVGPEVLSTTASPIFSYVPILSGTVTVTTTAGVTYYDGADGQLINASTGVGIAAYIDYLSGGVFTTAAKTTPIANTVIPGASAYYAYDNESISAQVPRTRLELDLLPLECTSRKLASYMSFDANYDLQKMFNLDGMDLLKQQNIGEISAEMNNEVAFDMLRNAGAGAPIVWDAEPPLGQGQAGQTAHNNSFAKALVDASVQTYTATGKIYPNFILCGRAATAVLKTMEGFNAAAVTDTAGPHIFGTFQEFTCIFIPDFPRDLAVTGYKGSSILQAGYVFATYMPVTSTQVVGLADFSMQQGFATSYAKRMTNPRAFQKIIITNYK
jgi:hypothetical protein